MIDGRDDALALLVEHDAAPVHAADVTGCQERAARVRRGENAFVAQRGDELATLAAIPESEAPGISGLHRALGGQRGERRERLRGPGLLARDMARGHGSLDDREQWLPAGALEYVQHAGLGRLDDRRYGHSLHLDVPQDRLRREVVIPQVVVDERLLPHAPAAPGIETQQRVGETIATQAHAAVGVGA